MRQRRRPRTGIVARARTTPAAATTAAPAPAPDTGPPIRKLNGHLVDLKGRGLYTWDGDKTAGRARATTSAACSGRHCSPTQSAKPRPLHAGAARRRQDAVGLARQAAVSLGLRQEIWRCRRRRRQRCLAPGARGPRGAEADAHPTKKGKPHDGVAAPALPCLLRLDDGLRSGACRRHQRQAAAHRRRDPARRRRRRRPDAVGRDRRLRHARPDRRQRVLHAGECRRLPPRRCRRADRLLRPRRAQLRAAALRHRAGRRRARPRRRASPSSRTSSA